MTFISCDRSSAAYASRAAHALVGLALTAGLFSAFAGSAEARAVDLGTAESYAVLADTTVTNTGPSIVNGDLGLSPGTSVTGFDPGTGPGTVTGQKHITDSAAANARADLGIAIAEVKARNSTSSFSTDLGGTTVRAGVHTAPSSAALTGELTLDARGNPDAVFVFQIDTSLTVAADAKVTLSGGAQACNVVWQVGSSATFGASAAFAGDVLASQAITLGNGASLIGRALTRDAAVTLDTNTITPMSCAAAVPSPSPSPSPSPTPSPSSPPSPSPPSPSPSPTPTHTPEGDDPSDASAAISYYFRYGTTARYGRRTRRSSTPLSRRAFAIRARRLKAGTTYHFQIVTVHKDGTRTYGRDRTYTTRATSSPARRPRIERGFTG